MTFFLEVNNYHFMDKGMPAFYAKFKKLPDQSDIY